MGDNMRRTWVAFKWCQKWDAVKRELELAKKYQASPTLYRILIRNPPFSEEEKGRGR
jgi:hypothetical protein